MKLQFIKSQKGATFWSFIWGLVLFVCFCYILILSIPPYVNNQKLHNALVAIAEHPNVMTMHRGQLLSLLNRKLNIDYGDRIVNLNKAFKVKSVEGKKDLSIDYELVVPVAYNVSLLFDFQNHVRAPIE